MTLFQNAKPRLITLALILAISMFAYFSPAFAQETVDLVVHYVEGNPAPGTVGYIIRVFFSVLDAAGDPIQGLTAEDFTLTEDSRKAVISSVEPAADEPIHLVLVIDTSGSMRGLGIESVKQAASDFISKLGMGDQVALLHFNNDLFPLLDFTTDHQAALNQLALLEAVPGAGTCLYDAAYEAAQIAATLPFGRRAVVLLTDGVDEVITGGPCSTYTIDDVIDLASAGTTRVPIYTLGLGTQIDEQALRRLAGRTGGRFLQSNQVGEVDTLFQRLYDQLKSQYLLTYESSAAPGAHSLILEVSYSGAKDQDTRNFLLPVLPPTVSFISPTDGQEVSGVINVVVYVSGTGEPVERVQFEVNGEKIADDSTSPYEIELDLSEFDPGGLELTAIAYSPDATELARRSVTVFIPAPPTQPPPPTQPLTEEGGTPAPAGEGRKATSTGDMLGSLFLYGLIVAFLGIAAFVFLKKRKKKEVVAEREPMDLEEWLTTPVTPGRLDEDKTYDRLEPIGEFGEVYGTLVVLYSDDALMIEQRIDLTKSPTTLGRKADNDIVFAQDSPISRYHAIIEKRGDQVVISETTYKGKSPTYGTYVNDSKIGSEAITLRNGDVIQLGPRVRMRFDRKGAPRAVSGDAPTVTSDAFDTDRTREFNKPGEWDADKTHEMPSS
ncbi:MAG: VWA domain-containing protein [Chloroflexota bacterium]